MGPMDLNQATEYARSAMPRLLDHHARIVSFPSVAMPGHEDAMRDILPALEEMFREFGVPNVGRLEVPGGPPAIYAELPGPEGSPVVTMYAHYDVQPCPPGQGWTTDPWTPTRKDDGRIYGRGAADDKAGVTVLAGILGAFQGQPPCTVRLLIEGEEEQGSGAITRLVQAEPERFRSDLFLITDSGPDKVGNPSVGTGLRGVVVTTVTVRTLPSALHSGLYGGAAPDAMFVLLKALGSMYDEHGSTIVEGLHGFEWKGAEVDEQTIRTTSGALPGISLMGTGPVQNRLWSQPAVTVIGIDGVPVDQCAAALNPTARARVSLRIAPGANPATELDLLKAHLQKHTPLGVQLEFSHDSLGEAFLGVDGPYKQAAKDALTAAYGKPAGELGSGGAIPLVTEFLRTSPGAEAVIWGAQDAEHAQIHGPNESVDPGEIERTVIAGVLLLDTIGKRA